MSTTSSYDNSWSYHMLSPNTCVFLVCHPGIDGSTLAGATYWLRNSKVSCKYFYNPVYLFPTIVIFWSFSIFQVQGIGPQLPLLWVWPPPLYSAFIHGKIPTPWSNPCRYPWYTASKAQSFMVNGLIVVTFWFKCICFLPHSQVDLLVIVVRAKYGSMFPGLHDFSMVHSKHQDGCLS